MSEFQVSDDARCIYSGKADIKSYGASSNSEPYMVLDGLDDVQHDHILSSNIKGNTPIRCIIGSDKKMLWNVDMQFKGAYDNKSGKTIKLCFEYDQELVDIARQFVGHRYNVDLIEGEIAQKPKKIKGEHGKFAGRLMQSKLMMSRSFWACVGTEERYLDWLRSQPCMITGKSVENPDTGDMRVEAAHVRDIKYGSGVAVKPEYFAIPLHPKVHSEQHNDGIFELWKRAGRPTPAGMPYPILTNKDHVRMWLQISALNYIRKWIQHEIKSYFDVESLSSVSPEMFEQYVHDKCPQAEAAMHLSAQMRDLSMLATGSVKNVQHD